MATFAKSLGLTRAIYWLALELATVRNAPITPSQSTTKIVYQLLEQSELIRTPRLDDQTVRSALYEPVRWVEVADWGSPVTVQATLHSTLRTLVRNHEACRQEALELWKLLADAEISSYLEATLRNHSISRHVARDLMDAMAQEWVDHSIGRRRYLVWAGVRYSLANLHGTEPSDREIASAVFAEMARKSQMIRAKNAKPGLNESEYSFVPKANWRRPILQELFQEHVLPIGEKYWTVTPEWHEAKDESAS